MSAGSAPEIDRDDLGPPEYLSYRTLRERRSQFGGETSRTQFHKLCCLADRYLKDELQRDIGFPKHWYKYGRMAHEGLISSAVTFTPQANHKPGQAYYPADRVSDGDFDHLDEDLKDDIFSAARRVVADHGDKTAQELEELQYTSDAPNEFVEAFGNLRWHLSARTIAQEDQSALDAFVTEERKTSMEDLLDDMLRDFPEDEYGEVYEEYLLWDDTFRLLYDQGASPRVLKEFLESFIDSLSKICLRFEDNSNIPDEEIESWEEEKTDEISNLKESIKRKRKLVVQERHPTDELETVSAAYNESIEDEIDGF